MFIQNTMMNLMVSTMAKYPKLGTVLLVAAKSSSALKVTEDSTLKSSNFINPIKSVVNLAIRVLCGVLVAITGLKLTMSSIALNTAASEQELQQKKDDMKKCMKNFILTIALVSAILAGGPTLVDWLLGFMQED